MKMKRSKSLSPEPSSSDNIKRTKLDDNLQTNGICSYLHILDFSDDVLLNIFKYLIPRDLMSLSLCCHRLNLVTRDRTLWRKVDFRSIPMFLDEIKMFFKFFQPTTVSLSMRGDLRADEVCELDKNFVHIIQTTCHQLKELIIESYRIHEDNISITDFPSSIEKLSLEGCEVSFVQNKKSYFSTINIHMPNLTCLILSDCQWFDPHSLMAISKIPKLKELRLNSCHRLGECFAYSSLATKYGFKSLEILDLRDTTLGDSEIGSFNQTTTLTHLYLECPYSLRNTNSPENVQLRNPSIPLAGLGEPVFEDRNVIQFDIRNQHHAENEEQQRCPISDRSICSFGNDICGRVIIDNALPNVLIIEEGKRTVNNPHLQTLVVRNYPKITNSSLSHLAANASSLRYLDVTGTSVTREAVQRFKEQRSDVKIVSSFDET